MDDIIGVLTLVSMILQLAALIAELIIDWQVTRLLQL